MRPTAEQLAVCGARGNRIKVVAFAGAAKTTTQELYARAHPKERILYVAFSKAVQREGEARFPRNTTCRTTHSLAFVLALKYFGKDGVSRKVGDTWPSVVAQEFGVSVVLAYVALRTLQAWFATTDRGITEEHVPEELRQRVPDWGYAVELAQRVWRAMADPGNPRIRMPHDGYLRAWATSAAKLDRYDTVLLDEAQDTSPVVLDFLLRQKVKLVAVGDPHQSIFGFRGAIDAMRQFESDQTLYLTQSFRFGPGVAEIANMLLGRLKGERKVIHGVAEPGETLFRVDVGRPYAVITRTNVTVFDEAVSRRRDKRRFHFVGGPQSLRFDKILDAFLLWSGRRVEVRDAYLRTFSSFEELKELAEQTEDAELRMLVKVVDKYRDGIPELIEEIEAKHQDASEFGSAGLRGFEGIVFCTAHKSKGLEFEQVILTDDYAGLFDPEDKGRPLGPGEIAAEDVNLLYVAITRARRALQMNAELTRWVGMVRAERRALEPA